MFNPYTNVKWYMKCFIYHFTSILHGLIRTHKWPAPNVSGFIAQLVRASHRYREVTGSNPVEVLIFQASIRNCLNCVHNCDDHGLLDALTLMLLSLTPEYFTRSSVHGGLSELKGLTTFSLVQKPVHSEIQNRLTFAFKRAVAHMRYVVKY